MSALGSILPKKRRSASSAKPLEDEPFYADDEMSLYREICTCRYYLPSASEGVDQSALHFIKHLFTRVQKRLGCLAEGVDQLRKHSLFKAIDWSEIRYKEIVAPSIPNEPVIHGKGEKLFTKPKPNSKKLSDWIIPRAD